MRPGYPIELFRLFSPQPTEFQSVLPINLITWYLHRAMRTIPRLRQQPPRSPPVLRERHVWIGVATFSIGRVLDATHALAGRTPIPESGTHTRVDYLNMALDNSRPRGNAENVRAGGTGSCGKFRRFHVLNGPLNVAANSSNPKYSTTSHRGDRHQRPGGSTFRLLRLGLYGWAVQ